MNLRTYRARTMGDCLAEVKKDLGSDAVILHTRTYKVGGWLGVGAKPMVEVTASSGGPEAPKRRNGNIAALKAYSSPASGTARDNGAFKPVVDRAARNAAARNEGSVALAAPVAPEPPLPAPPPEPSLPPQVIVTPSARLPVVRTGGDRPSPAPAAVPSNPLTEEIASLKRMVGQVLQCSRHTALRVSREGGGGFAPTTIPDAILRHYVKLLEADVAAEIADEVIARVRDDVPASRCEDDQAIRASIIRSLGSMIPADIDAPKAAAPSDGRPLTLALVGPTGVGKTTTVAKLAATFKLRQGKRVGLVTSDTYRIAAVDQLRTYAEIIGLPLKVAMSPSDMAAGCQSLCDCDIILIDTAGRSPRDPGRIDELRQFIAAARPHQTHLVLSSVASESVMLEAANRFLPMSPDRVIFTKLDEAVKLGVLITVARRISLPLSYLTTGQEVPDHIEPGRAERLAELLLDGAASPGPDGVEVVAGMALSGGRLR